MKKTLLLLVTSTALTAAIGLSAVNAMHAPLGGHLFSEHGARTMPLDLVSDNDDDEHRGREQANRGHDDDDDDDCEDDDNDNCRGGGRNPAPAGTVAPPQNGLFGNGTPPQVKVN